MKKLLYTLIAISIVLIVDINLAYGKNEVFTEDFFYYTVKDESVTITGYFGHEEIVRIPNSIAGYPVNAIADGAFKDTTVKTLYLPDTIMYVGEEATGTATVIFADDNQEEAPTEVVPLETDTSASNGESATSGEDSTEATDGEDSERKYDEITVDDDEAKGNTDGETNADAAGSKDGEKNGNGEAIDTSVKPHDGITIAKSGQPPFVFIGIACVVVAGLLAFCLLRKKQ